MIYLILPVLFILIYVVCCFNRNKGNFHFICSLIPAVILFFILGFKSVSVGADSITYFNAYYDLKGIPFYPDPSFFSSLNSYNFKNEYGFIFTAQLFAKVGLPYLAFQLFIYSIICFCLFYSVWKLSLNPIGSFFIFYCFTFFNFYISGLRQAFAMSLCLLAFALISKNRTPLKIVAYFLLVGIASFWHKSAMIFLVAFFFVRVKISIRLFIILVSVSLILFVYGSEMYELLNLVASSLLGGNYGDYAPFTFGFGLSSLLLLSILAFSFFLHEDSFAKNIVIGFLGNFSVFRQSGRRLDERVCAKNSLEGSFYPCLLLTFIGLWLMYTNRFSISFGRIAMYFSIFIIFVLPNAIEKIYNNRIKYVMLSSLAILFYLYFVYTAILPNYLGINPYSIIEGTI